MATVLESTFNQTQQWSKLVDDSIEDGFSAVDLMIGQGLSRTTGILARLKVMEKTGKDLELNRKILTLLANQAARLPQEIPSSVLSYSSQIDSIAEQAKTTDAYLMHDRIEQLRVDGYQVFPRTEAEIESLIEAKGRLYDLVPIFDFCCQVEELAKQTNPRRRDLDKLLAKTKEFEGSNMLAVKQALSHLKKLDREVKAPNLFEEAPKQPIAVVKPARCSMNRIWSLFTGASNAISSLFSRALGFFRHG